MKLCYILALLVFVLAACSEAQRNRSRRNRLGRGRSSRFRSSSRDSFGSLAEEEVEFRERENSFEGARLTREERKKKRAAKKAARRNRANAGKRKGRGLRKSINDDQYLAAEQESREFNDFDAEKHDRKNSNFGLQVIDEKSEENHEKVRKEDGRESYTAIKVDIDRDLDAEEYSKSEAFVSVENESLEEISYEDAEEDVVSAESERENGFERNFFSSRFSERFGS